MPGVVLNACQSAMLDERAKTPSPRWPRPCSARACAVSWPWPTRSTSAAPSSSCPPSTTGCSRRAGGPGGARGRQQMLAHPDRVCARGKFPLHDWLVPVLYQQDPLDFSFAACQAGLRSGALEMPDELKHERSPYGFIGRDGPLFDLERALLRPPPAS